MHCSLITFLLLAIATSHQIGNAEGTIAEEAAGETAAEAEEDAGETAPEVEEPAGVTGAEEEDVAGETAAEAEEVDGETTAEAAVAAGEAAADAEEAAGETAEEAEEVAGETAAEAEDAAGKTVTGAEEAAGETAADAEEAGGEAAGQSAAAGSKKISWLIVGGYRGLEGAGGGVAIDHVELLTLKNSEDTWNSESWCQKNMTSLHTPIESASINYLPLSAFIQKNKNNKDFSPPHSLYNFDRVIMCGGADDQYNVQNRCRWWDPQSDSWSGDERFRMLHRRYEPAAVDVRRGLWILGGRDGSNILINTEFLPYPHRKGSTYIKNWKWIHEKSNYPNDWEGLQLWPDMAILPMALTGHCAVRIGKYTVVIGGGTTGYDVYSEPILYTGPFPTNHVHLFDHLLGKWVSTLYALDKDRKITRMRTPRMNHGCLLYKEGTKAMVMVVGGVTNDTKGSGNHEVLNSVEILDFAKGSWVNGGRLPWPMTGVSLIKVWN